MPTITVLYGANKISVQVPDANYVETLKPRPVPALKDQTAAINSALDHPIGSSSIEELARGAKSVAVVVDDYTRPTPVASVLPWVLERLRSADVSRDQIVIVFALGTHRAMTEEEIGAKVGNEIASTYRLVNVSVHQTPKYQYLGTSDLGIEIRLLDEVANADLRVGIGSIVPHCDVGYSAGGKILLPGVCAAETVAMNHIRGLDFQGKNYLGAETTIIREDIEDVVSRTGPLFIVNCITTSSGHLYGIVAGDSVKAHRAGVSLARDVYGVPSGKRVNITVASAYPGDVDFIQVSKTIWSGDKMTQPGGDLIIVTPCVEGVGPYTLLPSLMAEDHREVAARITRGEIGATVEGVTAALAVRINRMKERVRISIVSQGLGHAEAQAMGFTPYDTAEQALSDALSRHGAGASVSLLTHGGQIYPIVTGEGSP
jgi:nickel-dependent lactate racemase